MRATCNNCKLEFNVVVREEKLDDGDLLTSISCSICGHRYNIARVTPKGQELAEEVDRLRETMPNSDEFWATLKEYQAEVFHE